MGSESRDKGGVEDDRGVGKVPAWMQENAEVAPSEKALVSQTTESGETAANVSKDAEPSGVVVKSRSAATTEGSLSGEERGASAKSGATSVASHVRSSATENTFTIPAVYVAGSDSDSLSSGREGALHNQAQTLASSLRCVCVEVQVQIGFHFEDTTASLRNKPCVILFRSLSTSRNGGPVLSD